MDSCQHSFDTPLLLLSRASDDKKISHIICLSERLIYQIDRYVYIVPCHEAMESAGSLLDDNAEEIFPANSDYAIIFGIDGTVRVACDKTGFSVLLLNIDIEKRSNKETDPIRECTLSFDDISRTFCVLNMGKLFVMKIDYGDPELPTVTPSVVFSGSVEIENCDPEIEGGAIWGNNSVLYAVYRSACSIFAYSFCIEGENVVVNNSMEIWTDHYTYVSALSSNATGCSLSGDYRGLLVVWSISDTNRLEPIFSSDSHFKTQITCIEHVSHFSRSPTFWVCDINGYVYLFEVDIKGEELIPKFRLSAGTYGIRHPMHIDCAFDESNSRLRLSSSITKTSYEFNFDINIKTMFSLNMPVFDHFYKYLTKCSTLVAEFNVIIAASWDGSINICDYNTGLILHTVQRRDSEQISAISAVCINANEFNFLIGTQAGLSVFYKIYVRDAEPIPIDESMQVFQLLEKEDSDTIQTQFSDKKMYTSIGERMEIVQYGEQNYTCLPVSDIILSAHGEYSAICFARRILMIQDNLENRPLSQILLDGTVFEISLLQEDNTANASLILVIVAKKMIRVLDALRSEYLYTLDAFSEISLPVSCRLWRNNDGDNLLGMYCTSDLCLHYFENTASEGYIARSILSNFGEEINSVVDCIFGGMNLIRNDNSIFVLAWSLRSLVSVVFDPSSVEG